MSKKMIGYDETKKMLNKLRQFNEYKNYSKTIREQIEDQNSEEEIQKSSENVKNDIIVINNVDVKLLSSDDMDMKLTEEQKISISNMIDSFKQQVTNLVDFKPGITINPNQIRMDGQVKDLDFKFTIVAGEESGLYLVSDMTQVTPQYIDVIGKFNKFYQTYISLMNKIIDERNNN
jgi:hypothetical protein